MVFLPKVSQILHLWLPELALEKKNMELAQYQYKVHTMQNFGNNVLFFGK